MAKVEKLHHVNTTRGAAGSLSTEKQLLNTTDTIFLRDSLLNAIRNNQPQELLKILKQNFIHPAHGQTTKSEYQFSHYYGARELNYDIHYVEPVFEHLFFQDKNLLITLLEEVKAQENNNDLLQVFTVGLFTSDAQNGSALDSIIEIDDLIKDENPNPNPSERFLDVKIDRLSPEILFGSIDMIRFTAQLEKLKRHCTCPDKVNVIVNLIASLNTFLEGFENLNKNPKSDLEKFELFFYKIKAANLLSEAKTKLNGHQTPIVQRVLADITVCLATLGLANLINFFRTGNGLFFCNQNASVLKIKETASVLSSPAPCAFNR